MLCGVVLLGGLALAGCVQDGPVATTATVLPPRAPRLAGLEARPGPDDAKLAAAFGGEYRAPAMKARLAEIVARLVPKTGRPEESYAVTILDSPSVNAFALPSGHLYLTRGLLALAVDEAEIAAVVAHEIAHLTQRHAALRGEFEARSALITRVMSDVLDQPAALPAKTTAHATLAGFSRAQELDADAIGIATVAAGGYDPYASARFLAALDRDAALSPRSGGEARAGADMFATHPGTPERIALARVAARRLGAPGLGRRDRDAYLDALDGTSFGDDPADGQVRGRHFAHARLGVAFDAPDGFVLENGPSAVLGATADGRRRLLFDAVEAGNGQTLGDLLTSSWADGLTEGSLVTAEVEGRGVARAASAGPEWAFRLAAVRLGSGTFRLILGERNGEGDSRLDRDFEAALASLRALRPGEAQAMRSRRIALVTARPGEGAEALASRMPGEMPLERFLVMNGLERGTALKPGERYKVVVE